MKKESLIKEYPEFLKEWNYEKNSGLNPEDFAVFSNQKVWWKCDKGHDFLQRIANRTSQNQGCPYCSGRKVLKGFNDFASQHPDLLEEWDYENNEIKPDEVTQKSSKKVHWVCKTCGRKWVAAICDRANGQGCKACGNLRGMELRRSNILSSGGSLAENNPELLAEWDYDKNTVSPYEVTASSPGRKVWWKCDKGHSYLMTPAARTNQNQGCPYCAGKRVLKGYNDLESNYPEIAKLWDFEHNQKAPSEVMKGSSQKVWWICPDCGKSYQMPIQGRIKETNNYVCFACSKKRGAETKVKNMIADGNTLFALEPELAKEWHPTKNGDLTPNDVTRASSRKVWWLCSDCGHEWKQTIHTRSKGEGCPYCAKAWKTSEPEQVLFYYISKYFVDAINSFHGDWLGKMEIDIFIPSIRLGIEYDGERWHRDSKKDIKKTQQLKSNNVELIRIRESGLDSLNDGSVEIISDDYYKDRSKFNGVIRQLFDEINRRYGCEIAPDIDVERDYPQTIALFKSRKKSKSLAAIRPDLISEWVQEKNGYLTPYNTAAFGTDKVWWKCKEGHEWKAPVLHRTVGKNCPYCSGKRVMPGFNDLATKNPEVAADWNYEKNGDLSPHQITFGSGKKVWWICKKCGNEWQQTVSVRTKGEGCPACGKTRGQIVRNRQIIEEKGSLQDNNPDVAAEWDYEKNAPLTPNDVSSGSHKKVWWTCKKCGHNYCATVESRKYGHGCPKCKVIEHSKRMKGRYLVPGVNDLKTLFPKIAEQWDYNKNDDRPEDHTTGEQRQAFWICEQGHSYKRVISARTKQNQGCPYCSNHKVLVGYNDLATLRPDVIDEWDESNLIKPTEVTVSSGKVVNWKCKNCGFVYPARVADKTYTGPKTSYLKKCPRCGGKKEYQLSLLDE